MALSPSPELAAPAAMLPALHRVERKHRETHDTWTLTLEPHDGEQLHPQPGQFTMLYAFGTGEVPISVSGDTGNGGPLVHTIRAVGSATQALCALRRGATVGVRGPFGNAWPVELAEDRDLVVVAGGIGLAPLRPVVYRAIAERERFGRVVLVYGARSPGDLLYRDELQAWREQGLEVHVTVDAAPRTWRGRIGLVTASVPRARLRAAHVTAFLCGPELMMRFAGEALEDVGVPREQLWVSLERNMRCGAGLCGHCQLGPKLICRDGAVFNLTEARALMAVKEL